MKNPKLASLFLLGAVCAVAGLGISARAQADPPGRVGRLSYLQGTVSFQPAGGADSDWVAAEPNRPLTTGDRLWTDDDARAELHVGSTAIRLDRNTGISFLNLADNIVQLQLSAGTAIIRLRTLQPDDSFEVDAPNLAFSILRPGNYRVDVDPDGNVTTVAVYQGQGNVTGGGRSINVLPDQQATFTGTDTLTYDLSDADTQPQNDFDQWAADRDKREDQIASARYVSPEVTGYEDLDAYGGWDQEPDYGMVWFPSAVAVGWAPYRFGHWVFVSPWGWTWIEAEPWGFAPFHYGRWAVFGGRWGWVPGPVVVRPVYAPALVAWVGGGPGFSFSVAFGAGGGVAWFPLGPREVFVPAYRVSDAYVTRVNVTNTVVERTTVINVYHNTNVTNITYVNQHVNGGITAVSHDTFVNARAVNTNVIRDNDRELASAPIARNVAAAPERASFVGGERPAGKKPPATVVNRTVVTQKTPPPVRQSFDRPANAAGESQGQQGPAQGGRATEQGRGVQPSQPVQPSTSQPAPTYRPPVNRDETRGNQPGGQPGGQPQPGQPQGNRAGQGQAVQPAQPSQPSPSEPAPANRPAVNRDETRGNQPGGQPSQPAVQPAPPQGNRAGQGQAVQPAQPSQPSPSQPAPAYRTPSAAEPSRSTVNSEPPKPQPESNPRAVPAPPVHPPTPAEQQYDNSREQSWQQQHQQAHPELQQQAPSKPAAKTDSGKNANSGKSGKDDKK
jgi:hypothetical protein